MRASVSLKLFLKGSEHILTYCRTRYLCSLDFEGDGFEGHWHPAYIGTGFFPWSHRPKWIEIAEGFKTEYSQDPTYITRTPGRVK